MQSYHPQQKSPSNRISQLHKTQLSCLTQPILNLKRNKKLGIPSGVKNLTLDFEERTLVLRSLPPRSFFPKFLKDFRNLESLKITCISFKNSPILMKTLRKIRNLKNLEVTFSRIAARIYNGDYLQDFVSALFQSCPRLAQLKLLFQDDRPITTWREDYSGSPLAFWGISRLSSNLKKLTIHFPISTYMGEKKILKGNLRSPIKHMDLSAMRGFNKLKTLDIALIQQYNDENFQYNTTELSFDTNKLFPNVKKFTWCVISSRAAKIKELDIIGSQIASQLKRLDDFGLGLRKDYHLSTNFDSCLFSLNRDLNRLFFVHNSGELSDPDASGLIFELSLRSLQNLPMLSLEFKNCKGIKNEFLKDLAQAISQHLTYLRSLRLCFGSGKLHDRDISVACKMEFGYGYGEISDQGVEQFANVLSNGCENLEFFSLEFENYSEISEKGVKGLCKNLEKLKSLKRLMVGFYDCIGVTKMELEEAARLLGNKKQVFMSEYRSPAFLKFLSKELK